MSIRKYINNLLVLPKGLLSLSIGAICTLSTVLPVNAAETIYLNYGPLSFSVPVDSLDAFVKTGKVDAELGFFLKRLQPEQQSQLRGFLQNRYQLNPVIVSHVSNTITGERLLKYFGRYIRIKGGSNGFYGIRGSLIQSAADPEGLSAIDFLQKFPTDIQIDLQDAVGLTKELTGILRDTYTFLGDIEERSSKMARSEPLTFFHRLPNITETGQYEVDVQTKQWFDKSRDRKIGVDFYLPKVSSDVKLPVIFVSNGLGGQRDRFIILAKHLASQGFAVVIPEHIGSDDIRQKRFFAGLYKENFDASEFIDRPLDITYVLNEIERLNASEFQGRLNVQQVGIFGYSFGGTTALSLAGAQINFEQLEKDCGDDVNPLNISVLYQCRALELPRQKVQLEDKRIKAAFLFVPFSKTVFGKREMSKVKIPIFWQAVDEDLVTPLILEQIPPFTWLTNKDRYLVVSEKLPHTRITTQLVDKIAKTDKEKSIDKLASVMHSYLNTFNTAFFKVYVAQDERYRPYLQASYAEEVTQSPYDLNFVRSLK